MKILKRTYVRSSTDVDGKHYLVHGDIQENGNIIEKHYSRETYAYTRDRAISNVNYYVRKEYGNDASLTNIKIEEV